MTATEALIPSRPGGPAWEIATLFPDQGNIDEGDYLWLTRHLKKLVEFTDGLVEVLPLPTTEHQFIVLFLVRQLLAYVEPLKLGRAAFSPLRVQLREGKYREPDVVFMRRENFHRVQSDFWFGADLVMEVVSPGDPNRDLVEKRRDYAEAGIPEYWIVDPRFDRVTVLTLADGAYRTASEMTGTGVVSSTVVVDFRIDVASIFAAGKID